MSDRDKSILEKPEKMCEYCCNFDKEHIGMDCMALCKLTMTLAYAEDYGGNCMFYNVPKEQIIVQPCKVGDTVYDISEFYDGTICPEMYEYKVNRIEFLNNGKFEIECIPYPDEAWGKTLFLTKEEAEEKLKELKDNA